MGEVIILAEWKKQKEVKELDLFQEELDEGRFKLKLIVDIRCQENEEVVFNAGRLDKSIFIKFADYKNISNATFSDIALEK